MTSSADNLRSRARAAVVSQQQHTVTVLSSLLAASDDLGYLPEEAILEVADFMNTTINEVWGVASFYTNFRFTPPALHSIEICWGTSCHLVGSQTLLEKAMRFLGLSNEADTPDQRVSFRMNTCLGACSQAPVISIDHRLIGRVTPEILEEKLSNLS